jgi:hypothetical protein
VVRTLVKVISEKMAGVVRPATSVAGCPVVIVKGGACTGKSVLLAAALQALRSSPPAHRPHLISFVFVPGGQREGLESDGVTPGPGRADKWGLPWALEHLAADISHQLGRTSGAGSHPLAHLAVDLVLAWRWRKLRAEARDAADGLLHTAAQRERWSLSKGLFVEAVVAAVMAPHAGEGGPQKPSGSGYALVCVVDGLTDAQVSLLHELVESLYSEVLVHLANLTGVLPVVKMVASCVSLPRAVIKCKACDPSQVKKSATSAATSIAANSRPAGLTLRGTTAVFDLQALTEAELESLAWWCLLRGSGGGQGRGMEGCAGAFPLTCSAASASGASLLQLSGGRPRAFCPTPLHIRSVVDKVMSRESEKKKREDEKRLAEEQGLEDKRPDLRIEGDVLYLAAACHMSAMHDEDEQIAARVSELPVELAEAFVQGVLVPLEVSYGLDLVEALVLQLLAATSGIPRADLKAVLAHQLAHLGTDACLPTADMAVDRVLAALHPFLLPARGAQDSICLEHEALRLAAWRHYDPMAAPLDLRLLRLHEEEEVAESGKNKVVGNLDGYVWVRGRVFSPMDDTDGDNKVEVELLVTHDSPISIHSFALFHIRKIPVAAEKKKKVEVIVEAKEVLAVSYKTPVARGLGQSWPFIDGPDDEVDRPLLSTATHVTDESHYMSSVQRGFPAVAEKRYALTPFSAQVDCLRLPRTDT